MRAGVATGGGSAPARLRRLIVALHERTGRRVVMLVDEYDKPILDALRESAAARANRDYLRGLYAVVKDCDAHVHFTLLTGVSKFSKVSLFSGLNNLLDLTLDPAYSAICGYRESDLDCVFAAEAARLGPGRSPQLVQRLQLAWGGDGLQPLRHSAAVPPAPVQGALVRNRLVEVPDRYLAAPPRIHIRDWPIDRHRSAAVGLRRRRDVHRGAAVPSRLPDHPRRGRPRRTHPLSARLSEIGRCARA